MKPNMQGPLALIGETIAGYRLERIIGTGATGAVYLGQRDSTSTEPPESVAASAEADMTTTPHAVAPDVDAVVAIKLLLLPWQVDDKERAHFHARFEREAKTLQQLVHPHIVSILGFGQEDGFTYIILPYLAGGTLAALAGDGTDGSEAKRLPLVQCANAANQIADALDYAHSKGVVHRDVKPANVLLDDAGNIYLGDFSIAHLVEETRTRLTTTGGVLGTPAYMAPEQFTGGTITPAVDIYSMGVLMYQLVTGRIPFQADTLIELLRQQALDPPPAPRLARSDLPVPAEAALLKALAKQPKNRFASASAFARAFAEGIEGRWSAELESDALAAAGAAPPFSSTGLTPVALTPSRATHSSRERTLIGLLVASGIALLSVVLLFAISLQGIGPLAPFIGRSLSSSEGNRSLAGSTSNVTNTPAATGTQLPTTASATPGAASTASSRATQTPDATQPTPTTGATATLNPNCWQPQSGVQMLSSSTGWSVGGTIDGTPGYLSYYDGSQWQTYNCQWALFAISMVSPGDGWAVGYGGTIVSYDGSNWTQVNSPTNATLFGVAMSSPEQGWAVGAGGVILSYSNGGWSAVSSPTSATLTSVAVVSGSEAWAVGAGGVILQFDGNSWSQAPSPTGDDLQSVAMVSADEGWSVGCNAILQYSGGVWTTEAFQPGFGYCMYGVAVVSGNAVWAAGNGNQQDQIFAYDGSQWSVTPLPSSAVGILGCISFDSPTDGWAEGDSVNLHYSNGAWASA